MLTIRDLTGQEEMLVDFKELTLNRKINGEKKISLTVIPSTHNTHAYPMVEEESILTFNDEEYVIKKVSERGIGNTTIKRVEAIHKFYVDMINSQQPLIHNGSMTFNAFLTFVFSGTPYTFSVIDTFYAQSFENLGNDNRLALLKKGLERYKAEMELVGNDVRFKSKIGNDTDFQFRYGHNIKTIEKNVDTTNLATVIRGKGKDGLTAYYRSPNADIFGEIDAPSVDDERFTTEESLLEEMQSRLEDTPEFSITIDFVDLRAAGYPYTVPNEGDRVFIIYEPMKDLLIETRIMEIDEVYDARGNVIKTNVTLANFKKTFAGTMFDNIDKRLRDIINDDGIIKYNVLDEAVRIATEALQSAQTELEFTNGILARDKENPNLLVVVNSNGIGISTDGGQTFKQAITANGVVTDLLTAGQIKTNNIQIIGNDDYFYWDGNALQAYDVNDLTKYVKLNSDGLYVAKGAMTVEREDGFKTVIDGYANLNYSVFPAYPPFKSDAVEEYSVYVRTTSTSPANMQFYTYRHEGRYLMLHLAYYVSDNANDYKGNVYVVDSADGSTLLSKTISNQGSDSELASFGEVLTVDLGTPDGSKNAFYLRIRSATSAINTYARVIRIWQEG